MQKQSPPKPKPVSDAAVRQQLEKGLQNYTFQLSKDLSQRARNQGLIEKKTVCALVSEAVSEYVKRKRQLER